MSSGPSDNEIRRVFDLFDQEKTGKVKVSDLPTLIRAFGQNPTVNDIQDYLEDVDKNKTGFIDYADFSKSCLKRWRDPTGEEEQIRQAFQLFDKDNTGFVSVTDVRTVLSGNGDQMSTDEINELLSLVQASGCQSDDKIDYRELSRILAGPK